MFFVSKHKKCAKTIANCANAERKEIRDFKTNNITILYNNYGNEIC